MSPQVSLAAGVLLMLLGISFFCKSAIAFLRGSMSYWAGFLPLTIVSPFFIHLPAKKNSLVKTAEGSWVHFGMAPLFLLIGFFCFLAGAEYAGIPAVEATNTAFGGRSGHLLLTFDKSRGFAFPLLARNAPPIQRAFQTSINLSPGTELVPKNDTSLGQVLHAKEQSSY
jgi:hypothetical protein